PKIPPVRREQNPPPHRNECAKRTVRHPHCGMRSRLADAGLLGLRARRLRSPPAGPAGLRDARSDTRRHQKNKILDAESRSEEHTSELQSPCNIVCRFHLEKNT